MHKLQPIFWWFQLFLNCLCNLQNNMVLTEIDTERLFCNIPEIYAANRVFWHDYIMPMLTISRKTGEPLNPILMKEGFLKVRHSICNEIFVIFVLISWTLYSVMYIRKLLDVNVIAAGLVICIKTLYTLDKVSLDLQILECKLQ